MIAPALTPTLADRLNSGFDRAVGLRMRVGGRLFDSWRFFSVAAFGVATVLYLAIGLAQELPVAALLLAPAAAWTIFSAHRRHIIRSGRVARIVFHRHVAATSVVVIPLLAVLGSLSWEVLDAATTAVLAGLAVGRLGCLRAGCCSGRRSGVGPRYPWPGLDYRRVPVQLYDAAVCVALVIATLVVQLSAAGAGLATALGVVGYLAARSFLDELRSERVDGGRHTEAQRLVVVLAAVAAAWVLTARVL
jgi:Prolipoprotein diacylglyceryl transferase